MLHVPTQQNPIDDPAARQPLFTTSEVGQWLSLIYRRRSEPRTSRPSRADPPREHRSMCGQH
eukprot:266360-Chlamydomonas_euryale.AAC.1